MAAHLHKYSYFADHKLSQETVADILTKLEIREYQNKEEIIRIGDFGEHFYIILDGVCEVQILDQKLEKKFKKFESEMFAK